MEPRLNTPCSVAFSSSTWILGAAKSARTWTNFPCQFVYFFARVNFTWKTRKKSMHMQVWKNHRWQWYTVVALRQRASVTVLVLRTHCSDVRCGFASFINVDPAQSRPRHLITPWINPVW